ncbi:hypothetical protein [Methylobacterium sp. ARG-1]|uniref:hypothetical protein n=1 Tax=Methylobacterium sp. ARG-1 TaxID=1692501 RepID=UPI00067FF7B9|nr:hypothetical protein [Methylobacterium sp. ARG-1]KNY20025.1 hypothetical protein AKJ13_24450 [Methylobacterium sp. ARG-1]
MAGSFKAPQPAGDGADAFTEHLTRCGVPWSLAHALSPWMSVVDRVGPGMTPWLRETTRLTVLAQREWTEPTTQIEEALERARAASEALAAAIDGPDGRDDVYKQRAAARAALYDLVAALRQAVPSAWTIAHGLGR